MKARIIGSNATHESRMIKQKATKIFQDAGYEILDEEDDSEDVLFAVLDTYVGRCLNPDNYNELFTSASADSAFDLGYAAAQGTYTIAYSEKGREMPLIKNMVSKFISNLSALNKIVESERRKKND